MIPERKPQIEREAVEAAARTAYEFDPEFHGPFGETKKDWADLDEQQKEIRLAVAREALIAAHASERLNGFELVEVVPSEFAKCQGAECLRVSMPTATRGTTDGFLCQTAQGVYRDMLSASIKLFSGGVR